VSFDSQPAKLTAFLEDLALFTDRQEKYAFLIETSDRFLEVPPSVASRPFPADHKVMRCESEAYVWAEPIPGGTLKFYYAVENPQGLSAKAMGVILDEGLSGEPIEEILKVSPDLVFAIFGKEVSMGKGQGLMGMVDLKG
jgi:cysteine desulfuration protein SufE